MKTKFILTVLAVVAMSLGTYAGEGAHNVDVENSSVAWKAKKVGGAHEGLVNVVKGELSFNGHNLAGGSIEIDMQSISVTDISNEGMNAKLTGHLNSADFFNTEEFPTASLTITEVKNTGHHMASVTGDLTIKGITAPITFDVALGHQGSNMVATAEIEVDRTVYDVRYGSKKFFDNLGDKYIYDIFTLSVKLVTGK